MAVSINGKFKARIEVEMDCPEDKVIEKVRQDENIKNAIKDKEIIKMIVVPNKIVNIVVK